MINTTVYCKLVAMGHEKSAPMTAVGYIRVSTDEQAESGLGLDAQRTAIRDEAIRRGWELVAIHEDAGVSGKTTRHRPGLDAALRTVQDRTAHTLVVAKLDRLSRSLADFANLVTTAQEQQWNLVALDLGIDLSTPAGEFLGNVMASASQWERRIIGQRTREALAVRKAQGMALGRPRELPEATRERVMALRQGGLGWSAIARELNDRGIPTARGGRWYPSTVRSTVLAGGGA